MQAGTSSVTKRNTCPLLTRSGFNNNSRTLFDAFSCFTAGLISLPRHAVNPLSRANLISGGQSMKAQDFRNLLFNPFLFSLILAAALVAPAGILAADSDAHAGHGVNHAAMGMVDNSNEPWAQQLKGQTIVEDAISGRANRSALVELQHSRLMEQMARQVEAGLVTNTGLFNGMSTMHQYDGQGYLLASQPGVEPVATSGGRCPSTAPVRKYDISAINVEITLNQWLDFYPGYMYVLTENIEKVRAEEAKNAKARENEKDQYDPGAVTNGIQGDYIQPLVIRGNQGDCVKVTLRNQLEGGDAVSLHIHGSSMGISATGKPATTTNPDAVAAKNKPVEMEWYIHPNTQEGGRQFHSYSNDRELTVLGMFGTFVVEPKGSRYLDPIGTGEPTEMRSGWQAIIQNGAGPDFREFVIIYHEVGDEAFRPVNKKGDFLPQRDPLTDTYRPGGRALNYRSEPFGIDNMHVQHEYFGFEDESMGYSSYTFGDAPTTIPRSYLGDPAKFRLVHGGSEVFHSHHPHGGTDRWLRSPRSSDEMPLWFPAKNGPGKYPVGRTH